MRKVFALAGVTLLAVLVLGSVPAYAHAALSGTNPGDGARLSTAPTKVTLTFSENIAKPAFVVVTAPDGSRVPTSQLRVIDDIVTATVAAVDIKGTYSMSYRVVSADSHPVEGRTTFEVTTGRTVAQVGPKTASTDSFVHRHRNHVLWGIGGAVVAVGLLLWPLRGRRD
jgi:methionine-rich copper-binding protein CopC